jgi:hypothetical protein
VNMLFEYIVQLIMGSRMQQEREGGSPNLSPGCKSLRQFESEWAESPKLAPKAPLRSSKEHKERGGKSNHKVIVDPGQDLNQIPPKHPRRRRSYTAS